MRFQDLTGHRFGCLMVLRMERDPKKNVSFCECICTCGTPVRVRASKLKAGQRQRCTCKPTAREQAKANGEKRYWSDKPCLKGHIGWRYVSTYKCAVCSNENANAYCKRNRPGANRRNSEYEKRNRAKITAKKKARRLADLERVQARDAAYRKSEAARYNAHWAAWHAEKLASTVPGLPKGWDRQIYKEARRVGGEVDHIIPLRPCRDCGRKGMHEPSNLQILPLSDNRSKNKRCQECWLAFTMKQAA